MPGLQRGHQETHEGEEADAGGERRGFDGREREGNHGGGAGGSDGAAAHPGGRRGNQVLPSEQSKGQMEGEPGQAGAGEEARGERHEADEAGGAGGKRRRREPERR